MRLAELIQGQNEEITHEWAVWARREVKSDASLPDDDVRDHFPLLLSELTVSLDRAETGGDGYAEEARHHAQHRVEHGFALREVVYEYRILRRVIFRRVLAKMPIDLDILEDLARMNELLDGATAEAVDRFSDLREHEQREQVETAAVFRERFIGIVSHDLRSPLNAIRMGASMLLRAEDLAPNVSKLVGRILVNTDRMTRMISDLLDLTRARLSKEFPIKRGHANLASIAQSIVETASAGQVERQIVIETRGNLEGEWDADRLGQVMSNLVGNALEHGDPTSPVRVTLAGEGDQVTIAVHNAGHAIPEDQKPYLFDAFRSARQETSLTMGLGLGLFIAHEIVRAHAGTIDVTSTDSDGTTFTVTLPRKAPSQERQETNGDGRAPPKD